MNTGIYKKGRSKEYFLVKKYKDYGFDIVQRTAGSHSPVDVIAIDSVGKNIKLIQSKRQFNKKREFIDPKLKKKLESENSYLNGYYFVEFVAL
jgi:Holliday junction resolvase